MNSAVEFPGIADAYFESGKKSKASEPLRPQDLESTREFLKFEQYRWLYASDWLGLRIDERRQR